MQANEQAPLALPGLVPSPVTANTQILIIDDNPASIKALSLVVADFGEITFATSGAAGIQQATKSRPDLILLDVEMPGMDGYEVCRQLKSALVTRNCSIIIVTSHNTVEHEVAALEAGAADFISKPLNAPLVRARVKTQLLVKKQADELLRQAQQDGLTGIYNRRFFDDYLEHEWRRHQRQRLPLGLALIDVDFFKAYNDLVGHQAGDECLRRIAQGLERGLRRPGEMVARYGGEEFAVVLPYTSAPEALSIGNWLCECIRELGIVHGRSAVAHVVTVSIGLASLVPGNQNSKWALVKGADRALYQVKARGRNQAALAVEADL